MNLAKLSRENLICYCHYQSDWFRRNHHHVKIASLLQKVESGEIKKLIITAPPRHGKTTLVSQHFPPWYLGRNPDKKIIFTTYGQSLASDVGLLVRDQVMQESYQQIFNELRLSKDTKAKAKFNLFLDGHRTRGSYQAVGRMGSITGKGADLLVIDDLIKDYAEAMSPQIRKKCKDFWIHTLSTRREPGASTIVMATRWHEDDLPGYLLREEEGWQLFNLPAINEQGLALWPERFDLDYLLEQKKNMKRGFESQYQGRPSPEEGNLILKEYLGTYEELPRLGKWFQTWDLSFKENGGSYVVGAVWCLNEDLHLVDLFRGKWGFNQSAEKIMWAKKIWPQAHLTYVEDKANGPAINDYLKVKHGSIKMWTPVGGKEERVHAVEPYLILGKLKLPFYAAWLEAYKAELLAFPKADDNDQVDVTSMALNIAFSMKKSNYIMKGKRRKITNLQR